MRLKLITLFFLISWFPLAHAEEQHHAQRHMPTHSVYSVQVVSLLEKQQAVDYMSSLEDVGHTPYLLMMYDQSGRPWYSVHLEHYLDRQEAQAKVQEFRARSKKVAVVFKTDSILFSRFLERMSVENHGLQYNPEPPPVAEDVAATPEMMAESLAVQVEEKPEEVGVAESSEPTSAETVDHSQDTAAPASATHFNPYNKYVLASVGRSHLDLNGSDLDSRFSSLGLDYTTTSTIDQNNVGFKLIGGYKINPYFAVEGGYVNLGEVKSETLTLNDSTMEEAMSTITDTELPLSVHGAVLEAVGIWQLHPRCALLGKGGAFMWKGKTEIAYSSGSSFDYEEGDADLVLGMGGQCNINPRYGLRVEWERFFLEDNRDLISGGVNYNF